MRRFPKIKYPNDPETDGLLGGEVVVTEKLDGANFRFFVDEDLNIVSGSRNVEFTEDGEPLPLEDINKSFRHAVDFLRTELDDIALSTMEGAGTFYGEAMHEHSLVYEDITYGNAFGGGSNHPVDDTPNVVLFDWSNANGQWVHWDTFEALTDELGLPTTRVLARGEPDELDDDALEIPEESMFGGPPEGIVVRRVDGLVRAKKVAEDFKETNATTFNDPNKAQSDGVEFVAMFVTDARIRDIAHDLVDEGGYDHLQMQMMEDLPREVLKDVMAEEGWNLLCDEYGFEAEFDEEFKKAVRDRTSRKCARVLRTLCQQI